MKVIFHLDLDSYFVSAHRTIDPRLIGKPVAITAGGRRSIISAVSYEAKNLGVYVPQPFYKAQELVPDLISVHPDFALYTTLSTKLFEYISNKYTTKIEVASIDECYIDVTDIWQKFNSPLELAKQMQEDIMRELKLPASIGISSNKFAAKMSTDVNKPYGITITKPGKFLDTFGSWEIIKMNGIGRPTAAKLNKLGIKNIKELAGFNPEVLEHELGIVGPTLIAHANGEGDDEIDTSHNDLKGIGNEVTFQDYDRSERKEILEVFSHLALTVSIRAKNRNKVGSVISINFKVKGGKEVKRIGKQRTLATPTNDYDQIFKVATELFDELWKQETLKFVGLSLGKLTNMFDTTYQTSLFEESIEKTKVQKIVQDINRQFKSKVVVTGKEGALDINKEKNQSRYVESDRILKHYNKK